MVLDARRVRRRVGHPRLAAPDVEHAHAAEGHLLAQQVQLGVGVVREQAQRAQQLAQGALDVC